MSGLFRCLKPCPNCHKRVATDGHGFFYCYRCGWEKGNYDKRKPRTPWYPENDDFLMKHYQERGARYCAEKLGYALITVCVHAKKLGLSVPRENKR